MSAFLRGVARVALAGVVWLGWPRWSSVAAASEPPPAPPPAPHVDLAFRYESLIIPAYGAAGGFATGALFVEQDVGAALWIGEHFFLELTGGGGLGDLTARSDIAGEVVGQLGLGFALSTDPELPIRLSIDWRPAALWNFANGAMTGSLVGARVAVALGELRLAPWFLLAPDGATLWGFSLGWVL